DLTKPTLLRIHIIKQSTEYYTVLKSDHHSISDGWSLPILLDRLHQHYQALLDHKVLSLQQDDAYLQTQAYIHNHKPSVVAHWKDTLSDIQFANDINPLLSRPIDLNSYQSVTDPQSVRLEIKGDRYQALKSFTRQYGLTLNTIVQFIWHKLLQVYSSSNQTIVGTTVSGRDLPIEGIESSVGLYINTLPLIVDWSNNGTILSQLQNIQESLTDMNAHSFVDLAKIQQGANRLFHSLLAFENYPIPQGSEESVANKISLRNIVEKVYYPLNIVAYEQQRALTINLQYDGLYLDQNKANQHIETLKQLVGKVVDSS
ncbi:condensation domain-containing protein, partial [uncultured Aquimarina sp.]|uniref:condensation domain-containing protein n=1 Tax=uncultured Aquimarina sp. TaxID=575652 RepID=UPI0026056959